MVDQIRKTGPARLGMLAGLLSVALWAAPAEERTAHWREDLHILSAAFSSKGTTVDFPRGISTRGQKDFNKLYPRFQTDIDALDADIPKLSDGEIVLRLMKIVASAGVAHNVVRTPMGLGFFARLPLDFSWYADGLAVTAASAEYEGALGSRVLKIGDKTPEQVLTELAPYIPHENDNWLRVSAPGLMRCQVVLKHAGLTDSEGQVALTLQRADGNVFALKVKPADPQTKMLSALEALHVPASLSTSRPRQYYWHQYLEDSGTLYIQYNVCANDPHLQFSDFAVRVLADADAHAVKRVVIDMRENGGGNSEVIHPLKNGLAARMGKIGHVCVLIGPRTFSSGILSALELRSSLHATLVGEPTGGSTSGYGEVKVVTLPNSKLMVQYTTKWFGPKDSEPGALTPDLPAPRKLADVLSGRDPALEAALGAP